MEPQSAFPTHADYQELLAAAALDTLAPDERLALDAHLADCPTCPADLSRLRAAVDAYPLALGDREPSAALRGRIEAAIRAESIPSGRTVAGPRPGPLVRPRPDGGGARPAAPSRFPSPLANPWAIAAALLLAVSLGLLAWNLQLRGETEPRERIDVVALQPADPSIPVVGEVTYLADRRVAVLAVRDLPPLAAGQVYQAWLIGEGGPPEPAGSFAATVADFAVAVDRDRFQTLALTIEPGPLGSPAPTGAPIAQASLPPA